jgi:hypothetical protein
VVFLRRVSHDQLVSKRIELVLRHAVANRSEETERILQTRRFGHRCQPTGAQDRTRAAVWIFLPVRVLPQAARVSKRNELGRATARVQISFRRDRVNNAETSRVWAQMPTQAGA